MWWLIWPKVKYKVPSERGNKIRPRYWFHIMPWYYTIDLEINGLSVKEVLSKYNIKPKSYSYDVDQGLYPFWSKETEQIITVRFKNKKEAMAAKIILSSIIKI